MEIVAHALWATALAKTADLKTPGRIRAGRFALWAMFPDIFAFAPGITAAVLYRIFSGGQPHPHGHHLLNIELYDPSHSLVVFVPVFLAVWLVLRRPVWAMLGWGLHILMDIPTHSAHFPTPFLWPVSSYRIIGVSWRDWWFMAANYAALACVFALLWFVRRRASSAAEPVSLQPLANARGSEPRP